MTSCLLSADWAALLVSSLALLVTVLIGWQVYVLIDLRRIKAESDKARRRMEVEITETINRQRIAAEHQLMFIYKALLCVQAGDYVEAAKTALQAYERNAALKDSVYSTLAHHVLRASLPVCADNKSLVDALCLSQYSRQALDAAIEAAQKGDASLDRDTARILKAEIRRRYGDSE